MVGDGVKKIIILLACVFVLMTGSVYAAEISDWSKADYENLSKSGILTDDVVSQRLKESISRREVCEILVNLYEQITGEEIVCGHNPFIDTDDEAVVKAYTKNIVSGKNEYNFDPYGLIKREEFAKMVLNLLELTDDELELDDDEIEMVLEDFEDGDDVSDWAEKAVAINIKKGIISGTTLETISPEGEATREQAICMVNRVYKMLSEEQKSYEMPILQSCEKDDFGWYTLSWVGSDESSKYTVFVKDSEYNIVDIFETTNTNTVLYDEYEPGTYSVIIGAEKDDGVEIFSMSTDIVVTEQQYVIAWEEPVKQLNLNEKEARVFPAGRPFANAEEAKLYMTTVTVPVWRIGKDGNKYSAKVSLTVNSALATDVICIFNEIFESYEQFPIKDVGGYYWRNTASGKLSQHSYGTCIDINANENYYVEPDGTPIVGEFWKPYENPYSLPEDGIVVRTFAKYGWEWGGNCWSDKYTKDYMHFTYLGK